jgi:hypothetical protein
MQEKDLIEFRELYEKKGFTFKELEKQYNFTSTTLKKIAKRHKFKMHRGKATNRKYLVQDIEIKLSISDTNLKSLINENIDDEHLEMILGCLLGDSSFTKFENKRQEWTYHVRFGHCEKQLDYLKYKKNILKNSGPIYKTEGKDMQMTEKSKVYKRSNQYSFCTNRIKINHIYNMLMKTGKKTVTKEYLDYLTPRSLAFWYMDDGCYKKGKNNVHIMTQSFSKEENELIKDWFFNSLKIPCFLKKVTGGSGYTIVLPANSTKKFLNLIKPYMVDCMFYKNPYCSPVETSKVESKDSVSREDCENNLNNARQPELN